MRLKGFSAFRVVVLCFPVAVPILVGKAEEGREGWRVDCEGGREKPRSCAIGRRAEAPGGKTVLALVSIAWDAGRIGYTVRFDVPLDVDLPYGVTYKFVEAGLDGKAGERRRVPFKSCS